MPARPASSSRYSRLWLSVGAYGQVEGIGTSPHLEVSDPDGTKLADAPVAGAGHTGAIAAIHDWFAAHVGGDAGFGGVGHRVVTFRATRGSCWRAMRHRQKRLSTFSSIA